MFRVKAGQESAYADWKAKNDDPYGGAAFEFLEQWAVLMEAEIASGEKLEAVADACSKKADEAFGITGFMYGCAVSVLSQCWEHGETLRRWHNLKTQIGDEGERANRDGGTLNPATLRIGAGS
jgi:hypothetical protein